jgi:hypothetical protein
LCKSKGLFSNGKIDECSAMINFLPDNDNFDLYSYNGKIFAKDREP